LTQADFFIADIPIHGRLILAPMDGISDAAFRLLTRKLGSAYSVSEFINTLDYANQKNYQKKRLLARDEERPFAAQLLDNDAVRMAECAACIEEEFHPDMIDINMGCAAKSVAGRGAGVGMMRNPQLVKEAVMLVSRAVRVPVTVKMRLGWDSTAQNFLEMAALAAENGAKAIALHGRIGKISYQKPAQWQPIAELKRAFPQLPVIGNGDVATPADARRMLEETGCDAVMIGRAAKANPWIFSWRSRDEVGIQEVADTTLWQLKDMLATNAENAIMPFRKYLKAYLDPYQLPRETMRTLLTCSDADQLIALVVETFAKLGASIE
jgi:nifR3 family TIM-barrel protein